MKNLLGFLGALAALVAACSLLPKPQSGSGGTSNADGGTASADGGDVAANSCATCPVPANSQSTCASAVCGFTCNDGFTKCNDSTCQDISSDLKNCGSCGAVCPAMAAGTMSCVSGACVVTSCPLGFDICDNACVDLRKNESCGACHNVCQNDATCIGQICVPPGPKGCGPGTCGGCCNSAGNCVSGKTTVVCGSGGDDCDTCEKGQTCQAGICTGTPAGPKH